jgi:predicted HAD superfamily Cof-like phosphohydrolase
MNMIEDVAKFMAAGEQQNTPEQVAKQLGFVLEEVSEALLEIGAGDHRYIADLGDGFKKGFFDIETKYSDQTQVLDAFLDIAWVAIGGAIAMGADVPGAWAEIVRSNMSKVDPATGKMLKDANGKVIKPAGYSKPDLARFLPK